MKKKFRLFLSLGLTLIRALLAWQRWYSAPRFCQVQAFSVFSFLLLLGSTTPVVTGEPDFEKLIRQLGSSSFEERERATKELVAAGAPALEPLKKATLHPNPEIAKRALECLPIVERNIRVGELAKLRLLFIVFDDV